LIFRFGIRQSNGPLNRIDMFTIPYNLDLNSFLFWCYFLQFYGVSYFWIRCRWPNLCRPWVRAFLCRI
jgi:hypothetical protein